MAFSGFFNLSPGTIVLSSLILLTTLLLHRITYNLYLHPLRRYPGPFIARTTLLWSLYHTYRADTHLAVHNLHRLYGPIVRVAPNEILFTDPSVWKSVFGHRGGVGAPEHVKDPSQHMRNLQGSRRVNLLMAPREEHARMRKLLGASFSERALREQGRVLGFYVGVLMEKLRGLGGEPVDMVRWFDFTTFDIIGHLVFAESFDCLSSTEYHFWVSSFYTTVKAITYSRALNRLSPHIVPLILHLLPRRVLHSVILFLETSKQKLARRRKRNLDYTDILSSWLAAEQKGLLDPEDTQLNAPLLIGAGSETTATLLAGLTYLLCRHPRVYTALTREIRDAFPDKYAITIPRVAELKYLTAALNEALRFYPPTPVTRSRLVAPQGVTVGEEFVPGGCLVGVNMYAAFRWEGNFRRGGEFWPERFLCCEGEGESEWKHDRREAFQPFSYGPRNCIGRHLAMVEMRLIMARLLYEFDVEIMPECAGWMEQKAYTLWEKPPLMVRLRPVVGK